MANSTAVRGDSTGASARQAQSRRKVREAVESTETRVSLPVIGTVALPPRDRLVFYATLGGMAALDIIDWPLALLLAAGHVLVDQHHSRLAKEMGEALEQA